MTTEAERQASFKHAEIVLLGLLYGKYKTRKQQKEAAYWALRHYPSFGGGDYWRDK